MITVLIVDDHEVVRAGLHTLIDAEDDMTVTAAVDGGAAAVDAYAERPVSVVLMDLSMPGVDGIDATRLIMAADPAARVVVLTSYGDRPRITKALDAGACGYLLKDAAPADLVAGVRAAAEGGAPMDPRITAVVLAERSERRSPVGATQLSDRELSVLRLVHDGLHNKEIARELGISEKTVKAHLTRIFDRLGVRDRVEATDWAVRAGVFADDAPGA